MKRFTFNRQPSIWIGAITSIVTLAADFGLHLTSGQFAHIVDAVPAVMALLVWTQVSPANKPLDEIVTAKAAKYQKAISDATDGLNAIAAVAQAAGLIPAPATAAAPRDPVVPERTDTPPPATPITL